MPQNSMPGGTLGTYNSSGMDNLKWFDESNIRELAFYIGVDTNALKRKLQSVYEAVGTGGVSDLS